MALIKKFRIKKFKEQKSILKLDKISMFYNKRQILNSIDLEINQQEILGMLGPNGVGKTTLINVLLKHQEPDSGTVRLGVSLQIAFFDQNKDYLPLDSSLWNFLSGVPEISESFKNDHIMVQEQPRHIVTYLRDFLFTPEQVNGKISDLSGGEKSRLMLAVLMAKPSNVLILDEPTNDLDLETLDLLKEIIRSYAGTVIFVSHDRDFINSVASHTILFEQEKVITIHSGGLPDLKDQILTNVIKKLEI